MRILLAALAALMAVALAQPARSQTVIGNDVSSSTATYLAGNYFGQVITPPNSNKLETFSFWIASGNSTKTVEPLIFEWDGGPDVSSPIWTGPATLVPSSTHTQIDFSPGIALDPAKQYALAVYNNTTGSMSMLYSNTDPLPGSFAVQRTDSWSEFLLADTKFTATFAAPPTPIPTLSEWAMILLGVALAGGAALTIQRRRAA